MLQFSHNNINFLLIHNFRMEIHQHIGLPDNIIPGRQTFLIFFAFQKELIKALRET